MFSYLKQNYTINAMSIAFTSQEATAQIEGQTFTIPSLLPKVSLRLPLSSVIYEHAVRMFMKRIQNATGNFAFKENKISGEQYFVNEYKEFLKQHFCKSRSNKTHHM